MGEKRLIWWWKRLFFVLRLFIIFPSLSNFSKIPPQLINIIRLYSLLQVHIILYVSCKIFKWFADYSSCTSFFNSFKIFLPVFTAYNNKKKLYSFPSTFSIIPFFIYFFFLPNAPQERGIRRKRKDDDVENLSCVSFPFLFSLLILLLFLLLVLQISIVFFS